MLNTEHGLLLAELEVLQTELRTAGIAAEAFDVHEDHRASVVNMAQFIALRSRDRRGLQERLSVRGLSSLGRCEPHMLATVNAVVEALRALCLGSVDVPVWEPPPATQNVLWFDEGDRLLDRNAARLLGKPAAGRSTRIMVTLPAEAARDEGLVDTLVAGGMEIARINCAHDDPAAWRAMVHHVRCCAERQGRFVRILMDLAGPKLRTGPIEPMAGVLRLRPRRDRNGVVLEPARARLVASATSVSTDLPLVPVSASLLPRLEVGDRLALVDARGSRRSLKVVAIDEIGPIVQTKKTAYLREGVEVYHGDHHARIGAMVGRPGAVEVRVGSHIELTGDLTPARPAPQGEPVRLGCTLPEALAALEIGHRVLIDDGKIAGVVTETDGQVVCVRVTAAAGGAAKLRAEKGINVPDTVVPVGALTAKDEQDLVTIVEVADMVALSFVREVGDVEFLLDLVATMGAEHLGVVLKIETSRGFRNLPELVRTAMRHRDIGVMIARGDLAVEVGYERLAELQEEMLWLCEAAHVPAIWATEVLDNVAKTGQPSRAEITDAAMSDRAECVMLNKGPHILGAIAVLDDILRRMTTLQSKKSPLLRPLTSWMSLRAP